MKHWLFITALAFGCHSLDWFSSCSPLRADEGAAPAYECRWTDEKLTIDGRADEPAWQQAAEIDGFALPWLGDEARPAKTATRARLLWDREALYFFADMDDGDLYADVTEHDGQTWDNDVFELFFKPADDRPGYYEFQVNAAGTVMDMYLPRRGAGGYQRFKADGEFHLETKVRLRGTLNNYADTDRGWSVEGRIAWRDFKHTGGQPKPGEVWKFALCRYDYSVDFEGPELSTNAPLSIDSFHQHEDYAPLEFVAQPRR
jgi:cellulose/xylan binding protein with CBM9 domain